MDESPSTGAAGRDLPTVLTALPWVLTLVIAGAVVVMGAVASAKGWIPTGDDAFLSLRTRHLFSTDPILLNNASSAGPSAGSQYNHPGAFPLTLLAPVSLLAGPGSIALATAIVNAVWVALIAVMVRRIAGATAQMWALLVSAVFVWSMGGTFLVDPWNPIYGILPVAVMVVAAWGTRRGHTSMLAITVLAASVAFQTHLSLTVVSVAVAAWAALGALVDWRRAPVDERRRVLSRIGLAAAVGLVANAQLLADQFFGTGNLGKIIEGTGFKEATVSVRQVAGVLVSKLFLKPMWLRGSWDGPVLPADEPATGAILLGGAAVVGLTVAAVVVARRRSSAATSLLGVLAVAFVSATLISTRFPLRIGIPLPYFRWVWPLAAIWASAVIAVLAPALSPVLWRRAAPSGAVAHHRTGVFAMAVVTVVFVAWAFVPTNEAISPNPAWAQDISRDFSAAAVDATRDGGPVVIDQSMQEAALWVIPALMDQLDAAGVEVRADDAVLVQQTDDHYRADGTERRRLAVRGGLQIDDAPPGATELARHDALTPAERRELDRLVDELGPELAEPDAIRLTAVGRAETDADDLAHLTTGELPAEELLRSVPLQLALDRDAVIVPGVDRGDLERALELGARDGGRSIALYLYEP